MCLKFQQILMFHLFLANKIYGDVMKSRKKHAILSEEEIIKLFQVPYDKNSAWYDALKNADDKTFDKMIIIN